MLTVVVSRAAAMAAALLKLQSWHSKFAEMLCIHVPEIGESPQQSSDFLFPKREFGKKNVVKRSFSAKVV